MVNGSFMLLLLIYPLRKRFVFGSHVISLKRWFQIHMILGIVGPVAILYHCNFSLGSTNSNVALISMLVMVLSGLVGRFLYSKIHFGLYGHTVTLRELKTRKLHASKLLSKDQGDVQHLVSPSIFESLENYERLALQARGVLGNFWRALFLGFKTRFVYLALCRQLRRDQRFSLVDPPISRKRIKLHFKQVRGHISLYLAIIRKIAGLGFSERLFSLWHMFHLPIFFMLIITGFVHVYAVHLY